MVYSPLYETTILQSSSSSSLSHTLCQRITTCRLTESLSSPRLQEVRSIANCDEFLGGWTKAGSMEVDQRWDAAAVAVTAQNDRRVHGSFGQRSRNWRNGSMSRPLVALLRLVRVRVRVNHRERERERERLNLQFNGMTFRTVRWKTFGITRGYTFI